MTASRSRKSVRHARCLSTGYGNARADVGQSSQILRQYTDPDAGYRAFVSRFTVAQLTGSARSQLARSPAALKSP